MQVGCERWGLDLAHVLDPSPVPEQQISKYFGGTDLSRPGAAAALVGLREKGSPCPVEVQQQPPQTCTVFKQCSSTLACLLLHKLGLH